MIPIFLSNSIDSHNFPQRSSVNAVERLLEIDKWHYRETIIKCLYFFCELVVRLWTDWLESGGQIEVIYTELEKAFDKDPINY